MILMGDHYRELGSFRVVLDEHIVRHTDQPVRVECAQSAQPAGLLRQVTDEFLQWRRPQREEAEVSIMVGKVLMECHNGLGVLGAQTTHRHDASVKQSRRSREFHCWIAHDSRRYPGSAGFGRGRWAPRAGHWSRPRGPGLANQ